MARRSGRIVTAAVAVGLAGGLLVDGAGAAAKPGFTAQINGRAFKAVAGTSTHVVYGATVFELVAHTKKGRLSRDLAFACAALGFPPATFPLTLSQCNGQYQETRVSLHSPVKIWSTGAGIHVTIDAFDGTHAQGEVGGTLEVPTVGKKPATITNGKFSLPAATL